MTTNQLIAILFPLGAALAAALTGLLAKKLWVDGAKEVAYARHNEPVDDVLSALNEAERAIRQAETELRGKVAKPASERLFPQP